MTTVDFLKDKNGSYKGFICMGHAEYAKSFLFHREPDILCASISALVINTINTLEELAQEDIEVSQDQETGFIKCDFNGVLQEKSVFLLDSLYFGLKNISKEYGEQYLLVRIKEV